MEASAGVGTATVALDTGETAATTEADVAVAVAEGRTGNANSSCQSKRQAKLLGKILGDDDQQLLEN